MKKVALLFIFVATLATIATAPAVAGGQGGHGGYSGHGGHGGHVYVRPSIGIGWGYPWGHPWGGYGFYGYGAGWGYPGWGSYPVVYPTAGLNYGALDLDVSPERAEIWIDGNLAGVADDFDGFPEYLWLEKGTYDVAIYLDGYKTLARQYSIYPGLVIDVEDRLEPGEAVHPSQLATTSHERRDERLRRDRERQEELGMVEQGEPRPLAPVEEPGELDARGEPGRLFLTVAPEDASVYLDGRFLGTGRELARLRAGLIVDPGEHTLQVVRPGREEQSRTFRIDAGRDLELGIELSED